MKSNRIEVNQSSLVSLKAELVRKQAEVHKAKSEAKAHFIHPLPHPKKETVFNKKNKGVGEREERDAEEIKEDEDLHKKSRNALETKTKLYDKLSQGSSEIADEDKRFLVNFEQKATEGRDATYTSTSNQERGISDGEDEERHFSDEYDAPSDPEDDWVEYTDILGRTRKALRRDLPFLKEKDAKLAISLGHRKDTEELRAVPSEVTTREEVQGETLEMMSSDMKREMMRQKWEEQEAVLRDKADIHYQDVLFDEARSHGVGYYGFSSDETQRRTQQQELSQRRLETKAQQEATHSAKEQRQRQLAARLRAARDRQRARLGLPPQEDEPEQEVQTAEEMVIEPETRPAETPEPARKVAKVRPWDIGKEGVPERPVLSQEEWVDKKRKERPEEFAPPPAYLEDYPGSSSLSYLTRPPPSLFFTSKKLKPQNRPTAQATSSTNAQTIHNEVEDFEAEKPAEVEESTKGAKPPRVGAEIAPPPTFEYYGPSSVSRGARGGVLRREETESSISAGLKYLRQQAEERERKREKGLLDIV